jgi:membrane dipeptidase
VIIVDAHLDLAYNVSRGRDVTRPAAEQPVADNEIATVGLPDLRAGGVGLICATIFCSPRNYQGFGYKTADEARAIAMDQLTWYRQRVDDGLLNLVRRQTDVEAISEPLAGPLRTILLMEGADALRTPEDVPEWFGYGLRICGLAWKRTRAAGGTEEPGPLTDFGRRLVRAFDAAGIIHDCSHLADDSFWQLMELATGPVMASHSNCRSIVPSDRQLTDDMIRAIARRGGVIGINFYDRFLLPPEQYRQRPCTLADVIAHVRRIAELTGGTTSIGLGTDLDGGLGRMEIPCEITTAADLPRVADALSNAGFDDAEVAGMMGRNWLDFFGRSLPEN